MQRCTPRIRAALRTEYSRSGMTRVSSSFHFIAMTFCCSAKLRTENKLHNEYFSENEKGIYFRVDSVDKVDSPEGKPTKVCVSHCYIIHYSLFLEKEERVYNRTFCQRLAPNFLEFPKVATFVNVCQRTHFHKTD